MPEDDALQQPKLSSSRTGRIAPTTAQNARKAAALVHQSREKLLHKCTETSGGIKNLAAPKLHQRKTRAFGAIRGRTPGVDLSSSCAWEGGWELGVGSASSSGGRRRCERVAATSLQVSIRAQRKGKASFGDGWM